MSATGLIVQLVYRLRRHLWLGWPLTRWLGLLLVGAALAALILWRSPFPWLAAVLGVLLLGYILTLAWAARRGYVGFEEMSHVDGWLHDISPARPLGVEERVPTRASGWFTVEGRWQYYVDVEADFETVWTREHIVLGRIRPSRFLGLGQWPGHEVGWWYIFFQPAMIHELRLGHLHHGARPHPALRVIYAPDEESQQMVYLAFRNHQDLRRVWDDLHQDVPTGVAA